ncbi:MAG: hypothetical protein NT041_01655 [Candidatus Vogelbacteria bacterium]|nr:hypothetical protein [Candidatus Vogelbacteria bacterium]
MKKTEILRSSREREKKIKSSKRALGVLLLAVIVGGFLLVLNISFFRLTVFNVSGQTSQDLSILKQTVKNELDGYCLGIVPNNSVFFFSKTRLSTLLKQKFPGLQSVEIDSPNLNTLTINVSDRESKTLWCSNSASGKLCFYLNEEGSVYQTAPNFSDSIIMEFDSPVMIKKLPTQVISSKDLARAKSFLGFLKSTLVDWPSASSTYKLSHINVLPLKDFEAVIVPTANPGNSWKLLFNTGATGDQLITNFHSLIKDPTLTKDWTVNKTLDYLDLRFDNKVFYKFR